MPCHDATGATLVILLCLCCRWSVDAGVRNRKDPDFVTKDLWLLDNIQSVCDKAGFPNPLPEYKSQYKRAVDLSEFACGVIG